ncbi:hypothetical protein BY458DRAFT_564905 [Sporodiniella umbellata]|nr:hypothetical protein BY458DRAFT_564905 [Sporodiniella umbellata]
MLFTIMFQEYNITIESGEIVSSVTSCSAAANNRSTFDFDRRIDNVHFIGQSSSTHLPIRLIELENFYSTIKDLYQWCQYILHQSRKLALSVFKGKCKYETFDIGRPSTPIYLSPKRVTISEPLNMYYSYNRSKIKLKEITGR